MNHEPQEFSDLEEFTEEQLGFAPLSSGLGLQNKNEKKLPPLGAEAAAKIQRPSTAEEVRAVQKKLAAAKMAQVEKSIQTNTVQKTSASVAAPSAMQDPAANPALRLAAFAIDVTLPTLVLYFTYRWQLQSIGEVVSLKSISSELTLLISTYYLGYFLISESLGGQSIGKMLLGLRVVEDDKYQKPVSLSASLRRILILPLAVLSLCWGLISCFWDPKLRPWQDRFTGTIVRVKKS